MMRWASWVTVILGAWLVGAAFYPGLTSWAGPGIEMMVGGAVAVLSLWTATSEHGSFILSVLVALLGLAVIVGPFLISYGPDVTGARHYTPLYNDMVVGVAIAILGSVRGVNVREPAESDQRFS